MRKFYTAVDIMALAIESLPKTKSALLSRAKGEGWEFREAKGLGGTRKEFILPKRYLTQEHGEPYRICDQDYESWAKKVNWSKFIPIRYCKDLQMLFETNLFSSRNAPDALFFRKKFITQDLKVAPKDLICVYVHNDSMGTTIRKNGVALFDLSKGYCGEGVYLIRHGDELKIKRIQTLSATKLLLISDNREVYPEIEVDSSKVTAEEFSVMGAYLWDAGIAI